MKMWSIFLRKKKKASNLLFEQPVHQLQIAMVRTLFYVSGFIIVLSLLLPLLVDSDVNIVVHLILSIAMATCFPIRYGLFDSERFEIYEDKIIVRNNALRIRNMVLLENVKFVEEGKLSIGGAENFVDYYILNDGRKNKRSGWQYRNGIYNKKKYNLRIYKTEELEAFLKERFEIRQKDFLYEE